MTKKLGVIGHPVSHSKSPLIHGTWIKALGLDASYKTIDISPAELSERLPQLMHEEGYTGLNVTIPHKEAMLDLCDEVDDIARAIGAVNTVFMRDGKICGTNTDAYGIIQNIHFFDSANPFDVTKGVAVILGAGGAARATVYSLLEHGCPQIILTNRTRAKAETLAKMDDRITVIDWDARHQALKNANMLVNTTSLGMKGQPALEMNLDALPKGALVTDIVYAPLMTDLLKAAQARGNPVQTGIGMLLHQAAKSFHYWFDITPNIDEALIQKVLAS